MATAVQIPITFDTAPAEEKTLRLKGVLSGVVGAAQSVLNRVVNSAMNEVLDLAKNFAKSEAQAILHNNPAFKQWGEDQRVQEALMQDLTDRLTGEDKPWAGAVTATMIQRERDIREPIIRKRVQEAAAIEQAIKESITNIQKMREKVKGQRIPDDMDIAFPQRVGVQ
jgi:Fe-S cluster assembly scaffold protein SufB